MNNDTMNNDTMNDNKLHRCELVQELNSLKFTETVDDKIDEYNHSWPHGEISYRLNSYSNDMKQSWQSKAVTVALRAWQWRISKLKFRKERNPDVSVDINVEFEDLAHFNGKKGVLAHAYYPGQGEISGDCHINDWYNWVPGVHLSSIRKPPLVPILIHEFGHSLGLTHDPFDTTDIMYPSFSLREKKNRIGTRSIQRAQSRYGKRSMAPYILAYFMRRRDRGTDFR